MNRSLLSLIVSIPIVVSCSSNRQSTNYQGIENVLKAQSGQNGRACVRVHDIDGYNVDDRVITIDGGRRYYVGTTLMRCFAADGSIRMAFKGPAGGDFCGAPNSSIIGTNGKCVMKSLFRYESREAAFNALNAAKATLQEQQKNQEKEEQQQGKDKIQQAAN